MLFDAFRLQMRYDRRTRKVHCQVALTATTLQSQQPAATAAIQRSTKPTILVVRA
jgi:hypothetical protein